MKVTYLVQTAARQFVASVVISKSENPATVVLAHVAATTPIDEVQEIRFVTC